MLAKLPQPERACATLGFSDKANLDDGNMWPTAFAIKELTAAEEGKDLRTKAIGGMTVSFYHLLFFFSNMMVGWLGGLLERMSGAQFWFAACGRSAQRGACTDVGADSGTEKADPNDRACHPHTCCGSGRLSVAAGIGQVRTFACSVRFL